MKGTFLSSGVITIISSFHSVNTIHINIRVSIMTGKLILILLKALKALIKPTLDNTNMAVKANKWIPMSA